MAGTLRRLPRMIRPGQILRTTPHLPRAICTSHRLLSTLEDPPPKRNGPRNPSRDPPPPPPPPQESENVKKNTSPAANFLATTNRMPEFNLTDHVIIVSGAARGLGLTQAEALLEAGATVYALDRLPSPSPSFHRVQERAATELGTTLSYRQIDVRDVENLHRIVAEIGDMHGRLDGLIAAAGIQQETPALEYSAEDANMMFEVNVTGVFMTAQAVARQMVRFGKGGSIAMIASMSGHVANRLARNLASEWGEYGIRVNTISPGYIVTAMVEELFQKYPERREEWPKQNMLGKLSRPEDFRGAAVFLMSPASSFMTAADMRIDGGHTAW
ncbi:MAG: hypothetical protein Q9178_005554 [Gyalolechia marmorata]